MKELRRTIKQSDFLLSVQKERLLAILNGKQVEANPNPLVENIERVVDEIFRCLFGVSLDDLTPLERREITRIIAKALKKEA